VIDELLRTGTRYKPSTIRTHIVSRMCANAPDHHASTYDDPERVADGGMAAVELRSLAMSGPGIECDELGFSFSHALRCLRLLLSCIQPTFAVLSAGGTRLPTA
jgi:hypothetical protein